MDYAARAREIIAAIEHITIATVDYDGQPWNTPVYAAFDEQYHFFWTSHKENQHSRNIRTNPKIFIVIYDAAERIFEKKVGVYILGTARELTDPEDIRRARSYTQARKDKAADDPRQFVGDALRRVYEAMPIQTWINADERAPDGTFLRDYRIEVNLNG